LLAQDLVVWKRIGVDVRRVEIKRFHRVCPYFLLILERAEGIMTGETST